MKKVKMKKVFGIISKVLAGIGIALALFLLLTFIYHIIKMKKEEALISKPLGKMVTVDGHQMCVYSGGKGERTLVFLSGSGVVCPILDYKGLYSLLEEDYRVAVIEKFGYGFSDVVDEERSFDKMLAQDRDVLSKAGIDGPYILCPHSMSGLEAILWAQNYPDEVEAIVGLDMVVPGFYDDFDFKGTVRYEKNAGLARKMGLIRFFYTDGAISPTLSEDEKKVYKALAAKKAVNCDIVNETLAIPKACEEINKNPMPAQKMLMFISNGPGNLGEAPKKFARKLPNCRSVELDCGHNIHYYEYERIAREIREFIEK